MGYKSNPFNSPKGQELMKDIFNLMFISPERKPSQIESDSKQRQIAHYKGNIINIVKPYITMVGIDVLMDNI